MSPDEVEIYKWVVVNWIRMRAWYGAISKPYWESCMHLIDDGDM